MKENSIKITKSDKTYVLFSNLDNRQLELLQKVQLIFDLALDNKNSDKTVGFATKQLIKNLK